MVKTQRHLFVCISVLCACMGGGRGVGAYAIGIQVRKKRKNARNIDGKSPPPYLSVVRAFFLEDGVEMDPPFFLFLFSFFLRHV